MVSILGALTDQYERLAETGEAPGYGYSSELVSFAIALSPDGSPVAVADIRDTAGKSARPARHRVPRPVVRAVNVAPNFLWDKTGYVLGVTRDGTTGGAVPVRRREHDEFKRLHSKLLSGDGRRGSCGAREVP